MSSTPTPYNRQANFVTQAQGNPAITVSQVATSMDAEFDAVETAMDKTQARLAEIQRDDGMVANGVVGIGALHAEVIAMISSQGGSFTGAWSTGRAYAVGDGIAQAGTFYYCIVAHTSGVFATDVGAGKWVAFVAADGTITTPKLADGAVTTAKIDSGAVSTAKLADASVTTVKIADAAVTGAKVLDGAITSGKVADGSVLTAKLADGAATTAKIGDLSVTQGKIAAGAVSTDKIDPNGIDASTINWTAISEWQPSTSYAKGALVSYLGIGYRRSVAGVSGTTFNITNWQQVTPTATTPLDASVTAAKLSSAVSALQPKAYGQISATGTVTGGYNISGVTVATNVFTITFAAGVLTANSIIQVTVGVGGALGCGARVSSLTPASNQLVVTTHTTTNPNVHPFFITVI